MTDDEADKAMTALAEALVCINVRLRALGLVPCLSSVEQMSANEDIDNVWADAAFCLLVKKASHISIACWLAADLRIEGKKAKVAVKHSVARISIDREVH